MLGDNKISLRLTRDPKSQNKKKHMNVIYHHVRTAESQNKITQELG